MKTTFTASDVGKSFHTATEGVTAKLVEFDGSTEPCYFEYSNGGGKWCDREGVLVGFTSDDPDTVHPDRPVEEAKTFTEKEVRKAIELARCPDLTEYKLGYLYTPEEIIKQLTP